MTDQTHSVSLQRLLYFSRASEATVAKMAEVFPQILAVSQSINAKRQISGCLLACNGWFMQILEGPGPEVKTTFASIQRDPRHQEVQLARIAPVAQRDFPRWSMCGRVLSPTDDEILDLLERDGAFDPRRLTCDRAARLLQRIQSVQANHGDGDFMID